MAELNAKARKLLDDLPPYFSEDPYALSVLEAVGRDLQRFEDFVVSLRAHAFPGTATDEHRFLGLWERMTDLPVEPENLTVAQRQNTLLAWLQSRKSGAAYDWVKSVTRFVGTQWQHWEYPDARAPAPNQLAIDHPFDPQSADPEISYVGAQVEAFIAAGTPAHIETLATYSTGFLVGFSRVGIEHL